MMRRLSLAGIAALALVAARAAAQEPTESDVRAALERDFHPLGQATMNRIPQDGLQRACTLYRDRPPAELAKTLEADQMAAIPFPSGPLIGDWKRGQRIAQSGRGMTWLDNPAAPSGGSCYNCHQLSSAELSFGTLGPSLAAFGNKRGRGPEAQRYAYGKIFNAKAYNLCSQMPRLGTSGTLTEQQIKDLVAYLLDPDSPVNK